MARNDLQGSLDLLVLKTLAQMGELHGYGIVGHIQRASEELLSVEEGSLYPALHRLERQGWIVSKWETATGQSRELKHYRLTAAGRRQLRAEQSKWNALVHAIGRVMRPATEG